MFIVLLQGRESNYSGAFPVNLLFVLSLLNGGATFKREIKNDSGSPRNVKTTQK
jgi:hypothetical protein